ncbi:MAG TPA: peroxiredoxin-like family protein [Polyangiaceae bacterium]|jgi:peroxiredoxin
MTIEKNLEQTIGDFMTGLAQQAPPQVLSALTSELIKLRESGAGSAAPAVGSKAPDFSLPDARGGTVTLSELLAEGPAVIAFYRGAWCPFCNLQLHAYQAALPQIRALGAELVAISPQKPDFTGALIEKHELAFPVLTDLHNTVARSYGLVFRLSEGLEALQNGFGNPLPKNNGDESWELPVPGTFVVDRNGIVQRRYVDANFTTRMEPAAILDTLRGLGV